MHPCLSLLEGYKAENRFLRPSAFASAKKLPADTMALFQALQGCYFWASKAAHLNPRPASVSPACPISTEIQTLAYMPSLEALLHACKRASSHRQRRLRAHRQHRALSYLHVSEHSRKRRHPTYLVLNNLSTTFLSFNCDGIPPTVVA